MQSSPPKKPKEQRLIDVINDVVKQIDEQIKTILLAFDKLFAGTPTQLFYRALWHKVDLHLRSIKTGDGVHLESLVNVSSLNAHFDALMSNVLVHTEAYLANTASDQLSSISLEPVPATFQHMLSVAAYAARQRKAFAINSSDAYCIYHDELPDMANNKKLLTALVGIFKSLAIKKYHLLNELLPEVQLYQKFYRPVSDVLSKANEIESLLRKKTEEGLFEVVLADEATLRLDPTLQALIKAENKKTTDDWSCKILPTLTVFEDRVLAFEKDHAVFMASFAAHCSAYEAAKNKRHAPEAISELHMRQMVLEELLRRAHENKQLLFQDIEKLMMREYPVKNVPSLPDISPLTLLRNKVASLTSLDAHLDHELVLFDQLACAVPKIISDDMIQAVQTAHLEHTKAAYEDETEKFIDAIHVAKNACEAYAHPNSLLNLRNAKSALEGAEAYNMIDLVLGYCYGGTAFAIDLILYTPKKFISLATHYTGAALRYVAPSISTTVSHYSGSLWNALSAYWTKPPAAPPPGQDEIEWKQIMEAFKLDLQAVMTAMQGQHFEKEVKSAHHFIGTEEAPGQISKLSVLVKDEKNKHEAIVAQAEATLMRIMMDAKVATMATLKQSFDHVLGVQKARVASLAIFSCQLPDITSLSQKDHGSRMGFSSSKR